MRYKIADLKREIRIALDQNMSSEPLSELGDVETLSLEDIIESKIVEAVRRVHMDAPYYLLHSGHNLVDNLGDAIYWEDLESGYVLLPSDFMRLVVFEMSDWERPVYTAISTNNPLYAQQRSRYKGIRGCPQKPVCAIVMRPEGKALEFYSCKDENATVSKGVYIPYPAIDSEGGVDISEQCYKAVIYTAAGLTLIACGEADKASAMMDMAKGLLGVANE